MMEERLLSLTLVSVTQTLLIDLRIRRLQV